ncbi:MAG TPA: type III pantothenate kinase [Gammaproteobacteria bacterium]|jgi:type III pantothenate kinase|uniref:type III pantothenate kinase n=1 Tax=Immundisolibacter sp. TaxID=1934948 RepID=UPI000E814D66|nr:type III pantothenate kinase [Gammaproteobacteria bacterium]HCZ48533.1 type III pantothenate kinase [Gammaproteobacteria bacterium]MCH77971.1 type III pantothenate kinase [Gammaproteobacteria bacterium]
MDLLFDLGHSRLKWAGWADGRLVQPQAVVWRGQDPAEVCRQVLHGLGTPRRVAIAAVVRGSMLQALEQALAAYWQGEVVRPAVTARCGDVCNGYREPARLGFDRWAALLGAWAQRPGRAAIVIDCGSAVTVDGLRQDGQHLGGVIFPGPLMMADAFYDRTGLVAQPPGNATDVAAVATADAVAAGTRLAALGGIERAVDAWLRRLPDADVWLTGGDAPALRQALTLPINTRLTPHLVLEGLGRMLEWEAR